MEQDNEKIIYDIEVRTKIDEAQQELRKLKQELKTNNKEELLVNLKFVGSENFSSIKQNLNEVRKAIEVLEKHSSTTLTLNGAGFDITLDKLRALEKELEDFQTQVNKGNLNNQIKEQQKLQSDVNILKNGKVINVEKPDNGSYVPILETSTDNFIIIQADHNGRLSVQISDVPEIDVSEMKYSPTNNSSIRENSRNITETSNSPEVSNILSSGTMLNNKWTKVATNADGKSIHACITPDGNVKILNNSKISNVTRPNNNSYTSVQEKSTGNYLLIMADNDGNISVQVSDVPEPRTNSIKSSQDVNVRNLDNAQEARQSAHASQVEKKANSATQSKLPIPPGFREHGQILGRRAIIGPDNIVMYESKGVWKKIN